MADANARIHPDRSIRSGPWKLTTGTLARDFTPAQIIRAVDPLESLIVWRPPGGTTTLGVGRALSHKEQAGAKAPGDLLRSFRSLVNPHTATFEDSNLRAFCSVAFDPQAPLEREWSSFAPLQWVVPELTFRFDKKTVEVLQFGLSVDFTRLEKRLDACLSALRESPPDSNSFEVSVDDEAYTRSVESALKTIESGALTKVVVARRGFVNADRTIDAATMLAKLDARFPDCFLFANRPRGTTEPCPTFLGATPERLVRVESNDLHTEALAGSAPRGATSESDLQHREQLLSDPKELREHALVVQMIKDAISTLGTDVTRPERPEIRKLSNVQHLCTPLRATLNPDLGILDAIEKLHPTPAVCGTPRAEALALLRQVEPFQRGHYAGVFGPIHLNGVSGEAAVTIRSALIEDRKATLYAGAGIVSGSVPKREAQETRIKLSAVLESLS